MNLAKIHYNVDNTNDDDDDDTNTNDDDDTKSITIPQPSFFQINTAVLGNMVQAQR